MNIGYQQTSLFAYIGVKPKINSRQKDVYEALRKFNHATNKQIAEYLGWEINRLTPRMGELRKMGLVREWGIVKDKSGRSAIAWEVGKII